MVKHITHATLLILLAASAVGAQQTGAPKQLLLPGSINATAGSVGALEPGNEIGSATIEQGVAPWQRGAISLVGFVDLTLRADSQGYVWNNTTPYVAGVKLVAAGSFGVLQAAAGVAGDLHSSYQGDVTRATYLSYWTAWQRAVNSRFPGNVWATSGTVTPREPGNWITAAHVEQGVTAWRHRAVAVVPFAGVTGGTDTEGYSWNNRGLLDGGVKVVTSIKGTVVHVGVAQRVDRAWNGGPTRSAPVWFVNLWTGWTPRVLR